MNIEKKAPTLAYLAIRLCVYVDPDVLMTANSVGRNKGINPVFMRFLPLNGVSRHS